MRLYLIAGAVLVIVYLLAQYYRPKQTDWQASYLKEDKIPYGLYVLNKELPVLLPNTKIKVSNQRIYNNLKDRKHKNTIYFLVAGKLELDAMDYKELFKFMNAGNQVFIATFDPGKVLNKALKLEMKSISGIVHQTPAVLNFVNPALKDKKGYSFDKGIGGQYYSQLDARGATVLGRNNMEGVTFVKYRFGKGALYLLPDPKLLTNYTLLQPQGAAYAAKVLSYLPPGQTLIWDELYTRGVIGDSSILRVLFKHDRLRWAYFISIISLLIFVLFEMKRRQRIIPVMASLKNTSLDFVKVVGKVYYQQRDNKDIADKKVLYFLDFLRTNYRLNTNVPLAELIPAIQAKSAARRGTLQNLFDSIALINQVDQVTDKHLIDLNEYMEEFFKQAQ